jgi:hypothetical protein
MTDFDDEVGRQLRRMPAIRARTIAEILLMLDQAEATIVARLATAGATTRTKLLQVQAEVRAAMERFRQAAEGRMSARLGESWRAGIDLWREPARVANFGLVPRINDRALLAMRSFVTDKIKDLSTAGVDRVNRVLGQVLTGALPAADAISQVQAQLRAATRARAMTIVYTEVGRAYSVSSYESMLAADAAGIRLAKRWLKSGKMHPRASHVAAHNQIVRVTAPFLIADPRTGEIEELRYPRDEQASAGNTINCGCIFVPMADGSTFGASVVHIPADPALPIRLMSRAEYEALSAQSVAAVEDRLARYLGTPHGSR